MTRPVSAALHYTPNAPFGEKGVPHAYGGGKHVGGKGKFHGKGKRQGKGKAYWAAKKGRSIDDDENRKDTPGEHVVDNDIIRLARRAGVERIAQDVYPEVRKQMENFLKIVIRDAVTYMECSLDEQHRGEEFDESGNVVVDEETNAIVMKDVTPRYGGCVGAKHIMSALERNGERLYWHRPITR